MLGRWLSCRRMWRNTSCLAMLGFAAGCGSGSMSAAGAADAAPADASADVASDGAAADNGADGATADGRADAVTDANVGATDAGAPDATADAQGASAFPSEAPVDSTLVDAVDSSDAETPDASPPTPDGPTNTPDYDSGAAVRDAASVSGPIFLTVDGLRGPTRQYKPAHGPQPISPYIYGMNSVYGDVVQSPTPWGLVRKGGSAYTAYNWTSNVGNKGQSACYSQVQYPGGGALAGALTQDPDSIAAAQAKQEASLVTISLMDHVASAFVSDATALCSPATVACGAGGSVSGNRNVKNLPFVTYDPNSPAFVKNLWATPGGSYCTCAGGQVCDAGCTVSTSPVYQDEFVNFLKASYGGGGAPVFFSLDNEPNLWGSEHPEVWQQTMGEPPCLTYTVTDDDIVERDEVGAKAVKAVWPTAKVFGPVVSQDGMIYAHANSSSPASTEFADYYLQRMAADSASFGQPLIDAFDVHYFNDRVFDTAQCVQNPRMFWDPSYTDISPAATDALDFGWAGTNSYFDTHWYPRQLIPRLEQKIDNAFAGSAGVVAPGLSISEYNNGCELDIAGGLAEADMLGIFGREGVFAAAARPTQPSTGNYLVAAFGLYRNYDGNGSNVGDTSIFATTSDPAGSSVYAFLKPTAPGSSHGAVDVVVINKDPKWRAMTLSMDNVDKFNGATLCLLDEGNSADASSFCYGNYIMDVQCAQSGQGDEFACALADIVPGKSVRAYHFVLTQ